MCSRRGGHLWYSSTYVVPVRRVSLDWCVSCGERNTMPRTGGWHFTNHALDRALDMALDAEELRTTLESPQGMQPGGPDYPTHYRIWTSGRIALVVSPEERVVVTCLWRGREYTRGTEDEPYRDN